MAASKTALPRAGKALVAAVSAAGGAVLIHAVTTCFRTSVPLQWFELSLVTFAAGTLTLRVPSIQVRLSVSEVFAFTGLLLYGPELGALTLAIDGLLVSLRWRMSGTQLVFNFANLALSAWVSGKIFFAVAGVTTLAAGPVPSSNLLLPVAALALSYFVLNSGLMAAIIGLESGRRPVVVWREHFVRLLPTYVAGASIALLLVVALQQIHSGALALIVPLVLISYLTMRSSFGRLEDAKGHVERVNGLYLSTIETLATAIDAKDEVTHGHIRRVQGAAVALARQLGVEDEQTIKAIEAAALLHDTGKIAVPEHILNKPGKLTPAEYEKMKLHAPIGAQILSSIDFPYPVVPIVRHHHENWDGTGYPDRLSGTEIPLGARILSVVDCFDALTSDRPYRQRMSDAEALDILTARRGSMYDPVVVDVFVRAYQQIMPTDGAAHPAAVVLGEARAAGRELTVELPPAPAADAPVSEDLLGMASLARAMAGQGTIADVGALAWIMLQEVVPCDAMALYLPDETRDLLVGRFAAGTHAEMLRALTTAPGAGIVGWVAANRRTAVNADPALDFGHRLHTLTPPLRSTLAVPLLYQGTLVAVLGLFSGSRPLGEDQARVVELIAERLAASIAAVPAVPRSMPRTPDLTLVKRTA